MVLFLKNHIEKEGRNEEALEKEGMKKPAEGRGK